MAEGTPRSRNEAAAKQNIFGIKVIAISTIFVGLGIAILGFVADNGMMACMVGIIIIIIAASILIRQRYNKVESPRG